MSDLLAMQRAVWRSARPTTEKIVLLAIIDYYSEASPRPWPSVPTLATQTSLGRTAVLEGIAALERDGVLVVKREHGRPNRYDLSRVRAMLAPVRQLDRSAARMPTDGSGIRQEVSSASAPVRDVNPSATRTGTSDGRDQSGARTGPVRQADPKEPMKEPKKEASRARARPPARIEEALALPVAERAKLLLERPREAERLRPQQWPEVKKIAEAFARAIGRERKLAEFARDSGLQAIVALLAAGNSVEEVEWAAGNLPRQAWWRSSGRTRGLASLSPEVVARALGERDQSRHTVVLQTSLGLGNGRPEGDEERRIHRNTLLANAQAGMYGVEVQRCAQRGADLRALVNELERREASGAVLVAPLRLRATAGNENDQSPAPGLAKTTPELNASRCLAVLIASLANDSAKTELDRKVPGSAG